LFPLNTDRKLGLDLVPRIDSEQVDVDQISPVELFRIHEKSMEDSAASVSDKPGRQGTDTARRTYIHRQCLYKDTYY